MNITVHFSTLLKNYLPSTEAITIDVDSYREVVSAVYNLFPKLRSIKIAKLLFVSEDKILRDTDLDFKPKYSDVHIVPSISGGSSFDSLGNLTQFYGSTTALGNEELAYTGLNKRILESSLFGKAQTAFDIAQRRSSTSTNTDETTGDPSTGFGSLSLTSIAGQFVPLHFGYVRTSGAVINQYIKHIQRGELDDVKVSKYV